MITMTKLDKLWAEIVPIPGQNIGRLIDPKHPVDFRVTYDENLFMQLFFTSDYQINIPNSSKKLIVRSNLRQDGKYAVCFSLSDNSLREQFVFLCWDIIHSTYSVETKKAGIQIAVKRFTMWQNLFEKESKKMLSEADIKGLLGELATLRDICIPRYGKERSISAWVGPMGTDRDFEFDDLWYEVKYVSLSKDRVSISSLDQLDTDRPGILVLCRAEKTAADVRNSVSLKELVNSIQRILEDNDDLFSSFKNRLALIGYEETDARVDQPYIIHRYEGFSVETNDFPRIRRSQISTGIASGVYELSIPALAPWETTII